MKESLRLFKRFAKFGNVGISSTANWCLFFSDHKSEKTENNEEEASEKHRKTIICYDIAIS